MPTLLRLSTRRWHLEITGPVRELPAHLSREAHASVVVAAGDTAVDLHQFNAATGALEPVQPGYPLPPVFFENTDYHLYFTAPGGTRLHLPPAARLNHQAGNLAHYGINFRNSVGYAEFSVEDEAAPATVRVEVFPTKLDYRTDYVEMRDEVAGIVRNLVLWVQARTFGFAAPAPSAKPTLIEWVSLMERFFADLLASARAVAGSPHATLNTETRSVPQARARRVDERALDRLSRRSGILPARVPETRRHVTRDLPVNRYVKAVLLETARKLKRVIAARSTGDEDADRDAEQKFFDAFRPTATRMLRDLRGVLNDPFFGDITPAPVQRPDSLVLTQHPHYAALEKAARKLNSGLDAGEGLLRVGIKDIALLYEYWCFLQLLHLLREHFDLEQQDIVRIKHLGLSVVLQKGKPSTVRFRDRATGKVVRVRYNRLFDKLPTTSQQPDNVIELASEDNLFLFDAKYRLAYDAAYRKKYGGEGPQPGDINTMHRYRDAIVIPLPEASETYRRIVRGAVVLFPHPDDKAYRSHRFFQSVGKVRVGGLPFLPKNTTLVREELARLLGWVEMGRVETVGLLDG